MATTPDIVTILGSKLNSEDLTTLREYEKVLEAIANKSKAEADKLLEVKKRIAEEEAKSLAHIKDRIEELKKEKDLLERSEEAYANRNELLKRHNELGDNALKILQNQIDLAKKGDKDALDVLEQEIKGKDKLLEGIIFTERGQDLIIAKARIIVGLKEKENEAAKRAGEQTKSIISATTGVSDSWKNTLVGSLMEGGSEGIAKSGIALKETFSAANIAGSLLMKVQESTIMMVKMADTTFATFNKTIGTTGELNEEIYDLSKNNALLGFTLQETAQAYTALAGGFVDFRGLSKENRQELAQTVTELQAIGIGSEIATKNISFFSKAMGLSTEQSISLSKELVAVAGALEMAPSKIASDFAAAASTLVVYGNRGVEVFKGLEAASKASGVEISNLISIASKMDTFQGAAEAAGRLNAVLGGGLLNSSQLLMASEEERIRLVIESVQSQGVQFNDLDKYTQKAIANAAGITDMAEANKLFGMSVGAYDDYIAKTALSSEEQANLEQRIQASKSAQEKFNYIIQSFAVLVMPLLDAITALVDTLMALNDATGGILPQLTTFGFVAYKAYGLLSAGAAGASLSLSGLSASITAFLTTNPVGWVLLAVAALVLLYKAFYDNDSAMAKFLDKWPLLKIYLIFVFSPLIFLISLTQRLIQFIGWATDGISKWLDRLIKGSEVLTKISEVLNKFSTGLKYFSDILLGIVSLGTLGNITDSFDKLIKLMTKKNSPALYEMADYMAAGFKNFANVITSLAIPALNMFLAPLRIVGSIMSSVWSGISTIVGATSSLFGKENVVGIKANFDATEALATTAAKITPDSMTNVKQLAAEVQKFNMELKTMTTIAASEPLEKLAKAINATNQQITNQVGKIMLEGREVGKFVLDTINKKGNIDTAVKSTSTVT